MSTYRFARLPSNSSVVATVTLLVCGWFLAAGAAIVGDSQAYAQRLERSAVTAPAPAGSAATVAIAPEAHFRIEVVARRG